MHQSEANYIIRRAIAKSYFEPELMKRGFSKGPVQHPYLGEDGLTMDSMVYLYFDYQTGCEYSDGDEWLLVEFLLPYDISIPDALKSPDLFTSLAIEEGRRRFWKHRELVRYRQGRIKRLEDALEFIIDRAKKLHDALERASVAEQLRKGSKA